MTGTELITVWLDLTYKLGASTTNCNELAAEIHLALCKVDPYIVTFRNSKRCLDYISRINENECKVVLVVSSENIATLSQSLLKQCDEILQIAAVYVLSVTDEPLLSTTKLHGHYMNVAELCNQLSQLSHRKCPDREGNYRKDFSINPVSETIATGSEFPSPIVSNKTARQEADFMYSSFLREILLKIPSTEEEMTEFCRKKCAGNESDLNVIEEFTAYYDACNAIFWFTRNTFLFRLLNKALRELDANTLYSLRYFIKDLHSQIVENHFQQLVSSSLTNDNQNQTPILPRQLYRGQLMDNNEFDRKIRYNTGSFFSVSNFFSTTSHENLASILAGNGSTAEKLQSVLFEIDIDQSVNKFAYANISKKSMFGDVESEILFTMGAIFRILSIEFDTERKMWLVKLKLTSDEDDELRTLTEHMREDVVHLYYPLASLAKLMLRMGNYEKAEQHYLEMLGDSFFISDVRNVACVQSNLGLIYTYTNERKKAQQCFEKAIDILLQHVPETDSLIGMVYNNFGENYREMGDFDKALFYYGKALENYHLADESSYQNEISILHNNIGLVYSLQHRYLEAIQNYEKSLSTRLKFLPQNHPEIATTYNNAALAFYELNNYARATEYYLKVLEIQRHSLPQDHPDFGRTYNNLGTASHKQGELQEAIDWYSKSFEILTRFLPSNHPDIARYYNNIALVHLDRGEYTQAVELFQKALEIRRKCLLPMHPDIAATYYNLAATYQKENKFEEALEIWQKSLEIWANDPTNNQNSISRVYFNMALLFGKQDNTDKQIEFVNKALEIQRHLQLPNHSDIATMYETLAIGYSKQKKFIKALETLKISLDIQLSTLPQNQFLIGKLYNEIALLSTLKKKSV